MKTLSIKSIRTLCAAALVLLLLPIGQAFAADINVDADCSLPNAIRSANGESMVAPQADCETGDSDDGSTQVDDDGNAIPAGLDTIRINAAGAVEGLITLDGTLTITSNIVIEGGGLVIDGAGNQIFNVQAGSLTANNLNIRGGWTESNGGAIAVAKASVTLNNSVVSGSGAKALGGGIYAIDSDLSLVNSVVTGNATGVLNKPKANASKADGSDGNSDTAQAAESGEAAQAESADETAEEQSAEPLTWDTSGGGIYFNGAGNNLVIDRSGLDTNRSHHHGGGLYIAAGVATITNSTFSGNTAGEGGAVYNAGDIELTHVSVVFNAAANTGGIFDSATLQLYNSILANNEGGDCSGTLNALIGNLIRDLSCGHDGLSDDPNLLLLSGSPDYYLPQKGSPAIDAASANYCLATDQRGISRAAAACDIGAAEYAPGTFTFQIQSALAILSPPDTGSAAAEAEQTTPEPAPPPSPVPPICASMPPNISLSGYQDNTGCKVLDAGGVGNQTVIDYGFFYAVDIFGDLSSPVKACFQQGRGIIILLDAANSPRNIVPLQARLENGMICADVTRAGTVVLMSETFANSGLAPSPAWDLSGCTVRTTDILNLRSEANSASSIVGNVLNDVQLTADMKANNYYRVNYYQIIGWLSSDYLSKSGNC